MRSRRWLDASAAVILRQDVWLYPATGTEFTGVAQFKDSTFTLDATTPLRLLTRCCSLTVKIPIGKRGRAIHWWTGHEWRYAHFDTDIPAATLAEGYISVDTRLSARVTTPGKAVTIR